MVVTPTTGMWLIPLVTCLDSSVLTYLATSVELMVRLSMVLLARKRLPTIVAVLPTMVALQLQSNLLSVVSVVRWGMTPCRDTTGFLLPKTRRAVEVLVRVRMFVKVGIVGRGIVGLLPL